MIHIKSIAARIVGTSLLLSSVSAMADTVTYDFTGTVTGSSGEYSQISIGSTVTGSFTLNYAATTGHGITTEPIGAQPEWLATSNGGSGLGLPVPSAFVFTLTATTQGITFATGISSFANYDSAGSLAGNDLGLKQQIYSDSNHQLNLDSSLALQSDFFPGKNNNIPYAYLSNGLPDLAAIDFAKSAGFFSASLFTPTTYTDLGNLYYSLTSLTPVSPVPPGGVPVFAPPPSTVPIPGSAMLLLTGLGVFGALRVLSWRAFRLSPSLTTA